jgi:lipid A 4'-phosphatase
VLLAGFKSVQLRQYRKVATYLLLVMVIGPGLLVNAVMKEGWGRPRPRQIEAFGGAEAHERVWEYDGASYGKSFPSGHAAMGFYFFSLYFLYRREGRKAAILWLGIAVGLGMVLGLTRMAQGGHFPSDVLWSAGVCYFVAAAAYYAMGLQHGLRYCGGRMSRGAVLGCVVALLGIALLAVGTPYHEEKWFRVEEALLGGASDVELRLDLSRANLHVTGAEELSLRAEPEGFGSPGSHLEDVYHAYRRGGVCRVEFEQEKHGFFATLEQAVSLVVPREIGIDAEVVLARGALELDLGAGEIPPGVVRCWDLDLGDVDLTLVIPHELAVKIEFADGVAVEAENTVVGLEWDVEKRRWKRGDDPLVKVRVKALRSGRIRLRE